MIQNFFDRGTALLTVLPDRHNAIACISSASQFNVLEANKVKGLIKPIDHFHLRCLLTLLPWVQFCSMWKMNQNLVRS